MLTRFTQQQKDGFAFENFIKHTLEMTRLPVLTEREVIKKFGKDITAIDHLIINDNYYIAFQDKWRNSKEGNSSINHFIQCVNTIKEISNKPCLAIYLSRLPITKVSQLAFDRQNSNNINYFISINNEDPLILYNDLMKFLYSNSIFYYDYDGTALMIE